MDESNKKPNVPNLRFSEFENEWLSDEIENVISINCTKYNPIKETNNFLCIELDSLESNTGILLNTYNSIEQSSIKNKFKVGNVLYGKLRPYLNKYYYSDFNGVCSTEIWVMSSDKIMSKWIYYFIQTKYFSGLANISSGSKMPRADWNYLKNELIYYPNNKDESLKICKLLDCVESRIQTQIKIIEDLEIQKNYITKVFSKSCNNEYKIKDIALVGRGRVISTLEIKKQNHPIYPVFSSQTTNNGIMGYLDTYDFDGEYITWTTDGANAGTVYYRNEKFNCTNVCGTLKLTDGFDAYYVSHVLALETKKYVSINLANPKLMNNVMANIIIKLPDYATQLKCSKILKQLFTQISIEKSLLKLYISEKNYLLNNLFI